MQNNLDTLVDIGSYKADTPYTCPNDGYITVVANSTNKTVLAIIMGADSDTNKSYLSSNYIDSYHYPHNCVQVKKGMRIGITGSGGAILAESAYFEPLA